MVMDKLGGFRLCRRLLETEERLPPFLSAEAMVGRGLEQRQGGGHGHTVGRQHPRGWGPWCQGRQPRARAKLPRVGSKAALGTEARLHLTGWSISPESISDLHLHSTPVGVRRASTFRLIPFLASQLQTRTNPQKEHKDTGFGAGMIVATWSGQARVPGHFAVDEGPREGFRGGQGEGSRTTTNTAPVLLLGRCLWRQPGHRCFSEGAPELHGRKWRLGLVPREDKPTMPVLVPTDVKAK